MTEVPKEIKKARVDMLFEHPFFASLALNLEFVESPNMVPPSMGTDGTHLFYHPDFIKNTPIAQLEGVIAHEIGHIILKHLARRQNRDPLRWNVAADYADNALILKEFQLPKGCLDDAQYHDKSTEWIYSNLPMKKGDGGGGTLDSHEEWKNWGKSDKGDGKGDGKDGKDGDKDGNGGAESDDAMEQEWQQKVALAATQARIKGKLPAHLESLVDELLQPKLDWKALLQDRIASCAKNDFRINPANKKHLYRGFYLPSIAGEQINIACGVDDSGSISDDEIREFLSEVKGICDAYDEYTIHLFIADAAIHQRFELHQFDPIPKVVIGRGGTDFRPVIAEAEKLDITSLVYFTDCYGTFPDKEPRIPVIWVCTTDAKAPWGSMIAYPREGYKGRRRY
jgi:predicted metal-dependent peptidase